MTPVIDLAAARQSRERFAAMFGKQPSTLVAKRKSLKVSIRRAAVRARAKSAL